MSNMPLQRRRDNPLIFFCLIVFALLLCGRPKRLTAASADESSKDDKGNYVQLSDLLSSITGNNANNNNNNVNVLDGSGETIELSQDQLAALLQQFQQSQGQGSQFLTQEDDHRKDRRSRGKSNRRKVLYDLSVRAHYDRLLHATEVQHLNISSAIDDTISLDDVTSSCEYYNDGMTSPFDIREMAKNDESIFTQCSHWTFRLCPKKSISQIHLVPSAITDDGDTNVDDNVQIMQLPSKSILSDSIQFLIPTVHDLGTYLSPSSLNYEKHIRSAWGPDEAKAIHNDLVEYYLGGDVCQGSRHRQSKVIYDPECCPRRESMMEEFFENDGQIMIQSTSEPDPCRYVLRACKICPVDEEDIAEDVPEVMVEDDADDGDEINPKIDPAEFSHMLQTFLQYSPQGSEGSSTSGAFPPMPPSQIESNKELLNQMFTHAYDSYFYNAFPASELKPLTCEPGIFDLVKIPALTLIDTLDTFIIMGNYTEFARSVERLRYLDVTMKGEFQLSRKGLKSLREGEQGGLFSINKDVSLFETTIRVLGGLLSAHQLAVAFMANTVPKAGVWDSNGEILNSTSGTIQNHVHKGESEEEDNDSHSCSWESAPCPDAGPGAAEKNGCGSDVDAASKRSKNEKNTISSVTVPAWEYDGLLLELAHDIGKRLLFAFDTETGVSRKMLYQLLAVGLLLRLFTSPISISTSNLW